MMTSSAIETIYVEINDNSVFWFSPEAELLLAAEGILSPMFLHNTAYTDVYGNETIQIFRKKYRLVCEINAAFSEKYIAPHMFEILHGLDLSRFSVKSFREHIMNIDKTNLPGLMLDVPVNNADEAMENELFSNYLAATAYFERIDEYINSIFNLAEELRADGFYGMIKKYRPKIKEALKLAEKELSVIPPLEYSDKLLHKTMKNRGPYERYVFIPTIFFIWRAVRFIDKNQFLFFSVRDAVYDNELALEQLKALADNTRYKIITLIKERGEIQGSDIASVTNLTAATVSHHMKTLREAGLITEQAEGNTKFYSLHRGAADALSETLKKLFP